MEGAAATTPAPAPATTPMAAPPAASPNYVAPPSNLPPASTMENGGETSSRGGGSSIKDFFSDINLVDVAISAFIIGGVLYTIHYYKFMMMLEKTGSADLSSRVQKMESALSAAKKKSEANASGSGTMKRKRSLISL
jgi:hypothetical protein